MKFTKIILSASLLMTHLVMFGQQNPQEKQLQSQIDVLKQQLSNIGNTIEKGSTKGKFSAAASDSLYKTQDQLMDLNDRLYWLTNKDSILNAQLNEGEVPRIDQENKDDNRSDETMENGMDSLDFSKFDFSSMLPKPKVKAASWYIQVQNGATIVLDNTASGQNLIQPDWKLKPGSNPGAHFIVAFRLGKPDMSNVKMDFSLKKKLITSNFIKASPWQLRVGIGLQRHEMLLDNKNIFLDKTQKLISTPIDDKIYTKNTVGLYYVNMPMTVWHRFGKKLVVEAGPYVSLMRFAKQSLQYKTEDVKNALVRKGNLGVNTFAYGVTASVGVAGIAVYGNYQLSNLFAGDTPYKYNIMSVGIKLGY